jgi:hypothetical protein
MLRFLRLLLVFLTFSTTLHAQKLSGQWTGGFSSSGDRTGNKTEYILDLDVKENEVSGYSYTYFMLGAKRCFTICRLSGKYDKGSKSIVVSEVERIKANTPPDFRDCLQTHLLTYMKAEGKEILLGKWRPATDKDNCGSGQTELERKQLVKMLPSTSSSSVVGRGTPSVSQKTQKPSIGSLPEKTGGATAGAPKTTPSNQRLSGGGERVYPDVSKTHSSAGGNTNLPAPSNQERATPGQDAPIAVKAIPAGYEKRAIQIIRTIDVEEKSFRVDLYDNGQVDGDTVSLYLNGKLMVSRQRLSTTPISLTIDLSDDDQQDLVMYAENLGTIPPNSALMVVNSGGKRYEVNITSSEQTNGAVRFVKKK